MNSPAALQIHDQDGVRTLTINRPSQRNALNAPLLDELCRALDEASSHSYVRVIVITGSGDRSFIAGADIAGLAEATPEQAETASRNAAGVNARILNCPKPVIASINGFCMGAGLELAMACDLRIASTKATFGLPEIRLGIIPGGGGTIRLSRLIGEGQAKALCMTGASFDAARAFAMGLVTDLAEPDQLEAHTRRVSSELAGLSQSALGQLKAVFNHAADCDFASSEILERKAFALCFANPDQREGMKAFLEKRTPRFAVSLKQT